MRHQPEVLKHHAHLVAAELDQLFLRRGQQVLPVQQDFARSRLHDARQAADHGGFARSRQPHDDEYLAHMHVERHVGGCDDVVCVSDGCGVRGCAVAKEALRLRAIDLPHVAAGEFNVGGNCVHA